MVLQYINGASPPIFILSSILFLLLIIRYLRPKRGSEKFKLPPGPKKLPIIGNLHQLAGPVPPHQRLSELAKQHGPVMHLQMGEISTVVVSTPETAKEVYNTHDLIFANRPSFATMDLLSFGKSSMVFASHGEYWRKMRKIIVVELLNARRVRFFRSIREEEMKNVVNDISSSHGSVINLSKKIVGFTNCVTSKTAFGQGLKKKQQEELIQLLRRMTELMSGFNLEDLYPSLKILRRLSGMARRIADIDDKMNKLFDSIITSHRRKRTTDKNMDINGEDDGVDDSSMSAMEDLVDVLLKIQESEDNNGSRVKTEDIKGVINDIFNAGTDSSSTTIDWAMAEILRNPNVMKKVQVEVREVLKGKDHIEESDIEGLMYLKLVVKETLRLHPPAPIVSRRPTENCKINGYDVPSNSRVLVNSWAIGRDPRYWHDPEKFEPERFLESSVDFSGKHFHFLPFGGGRRICPGITFASKNIELMLAALLCHFDWKLPDRQTPQDLDMSETFGLTTHRRNNLYVIATKVH